MDAAGYLERVILGRERGVLSWVIRLLLWPLSLAYQAGLAVFLGMYAVGIRKRRRLKVPVVSVGNLTFGGTGKTPAVQRICTLLRERGKKVAILSRGHGGAARRSVVVSDGRSISSDIAESGDEPLLLAASLPGVCVVVGKDRRASGEVARRGFEPDVIVLDDGLQYWQLHRDLDIVVLDASRPFGSGFVMPMGDLREPVKGLRRARIVLLNDSRGLDLEAYNGVVSRLSGLAPEARVFRCARRARCFVRVEDGEELAVDWAKGRRILAFCGVGDPAAFVHMLESLGAVVVRSFAFSDHHRFTLSDIRRIEEERCARGVEAVITTQKDVARLSGTPGIRHLYALSIELEIEEESHFAQYLIDTLSSQKV